MIEIKKVERTDLENLSLLMEELSGKKSKNNLIEKNLELISKNDNYILLGARINGKLLGTLMGIICYDLVGECRPFMVIENVIVSHSSRDSGIGKKLMIEIENIAKIRKCSYIFFVSSSRRRDAHKFYESLGYEPDKVKGYKKHLN